MRVARAAAGQWGVLSLDELFACGLSRGAVSDRVRSGRLHPIHRGVYAVGHRKLPLEGRFLAAVKACGSTAVLSHHSAAALWGFMPWEERYPEVTVLGTAPHSHPGLRVHRTTRLDVDDRARHHGIPLTSPARTLLDLAATLDHRPLRAATRRAQSLHRVNVGQLADALARHGRRRGAAGLAQIIATGPAPTRSELEDVVLDLTLRGGLVHPDVNVPYVVAGRKTVPDFRWPQQRLVLEADGAAWHDNQLAREDDAERQALLEAHGERVLRVTWAQAITRPSATLARLRAAGAPLHGAADDQHHQLRKVRLTTSRAPPYSGPTDGPQEAPESPRPPPPTPSLVPGCPHAVTSRLRRRSAALSGPMPCSARRRATTAWRVAP